MNLNHIAKKPFFDLFYRTPCMPAMMRAALYDATLKTSSGSARYVTSPNVYHITYSVLQIIEEHLVLWHFRTNLPSLRATNSTSPSSRSRKSKGLVTTSQTVWATLTWSSSAVTQLLSTVAVQPWSSIWADAILTLRAMLSSTLLSPAPVALSPKASPKVISHLRNLSPWWAHSLLASLVKRRKDLTPVGAWTPTSLITHTSKNYC